MLSVGLLLLSGCGDAPILSDGPFIGHTDATSIYAYARAVNPGVVQATLRSASDARTQAATASEANDSMLHYRFENLAEDCDYTLTLSDDAGGSASSRSIRTPASTTTSQRIAFASCANDLRFPNQPIWQRLQESGIDALVLLGDTPYIDTTDLQVQRQRRRAFHRVPELAALLARVPVWTTWDDHDFGKNDVDGNLPGKERSRQALLEWSALASYGDGTNGIYTSFRRGPIEVFLLDTRTFANTAQGSDGLQTLLGEAQWRWLRTGLLRSEAPFKIIASSMVWNGAVRPLKTDMWTHWQHERDRLWSFIGTEGIEGVVLLSGDVHRTRVFAHSSEALCGYRLYEFVTSPAAQDPHASANQPHPDLLFDAGVSAASLIASVSAVRPHELVLRSIDANGATLREDTLTTDALVRGGSEALRSALVDGRFRVVRGGDLQVCLDTHGPCTITQLQAPGQRNLLAQPWPVEHASTSLPVATAGPWTVVVVSQSTAVAAPNDSFRTTTTLAEPAAVMPPLMLALQTPVRLPSAATLTVCGEVRGRRVGISVVALDGARSLPAPVLRDGAIHFPHMPRNEIQKPLMLLRYAIVLHSRVPTPAEFAALNAK